MVVTFTSNLYWIYFGNSFICTKHGLESVKIELKHQFCFCFGWFCFVLVNFGQPKSKKSWFCFVFGGPKSKNF